MAGSTTPDGPLNPSLQLVPDGQTGGRDAKRGSALFRIAVLLWLMETGFYCIESLFGDSTVLGLLFLLSIWLIAFWVAVPIWAVLVAVARMRRRAYRAAGVAALVPILAIASYPHGRYIGDVIRFERERPSYVAALAAARAGKVEDNAEVYVGPPLIAFFPWGGFLTTSYGVIFDETGQAAKPLTVRLEAWAGRDIPMELKCPGDVLPLGGAFYVGHFTC
jgi:hypothetical protein